MGLRDGTSCVHNFLQFHTVMGSAVAVFYDASAEMIRVIEGMTNFVSLMCKKSVLSWKYRLCA